MSAQRYMSRGFVIHAPPGRRIATLLALALFGAAGTAAVLRQPAPATGRIEIERSATKADDHLARRVRSALAGAGNDAHLARAMGAYARRFPALVVDDVFGLGRVRVAAILARAPSPGLREPTFEEMLVDSYDLSDPAVARFVDPIRADPVGSATLVSSEIAFQRCALGSRLGLAAGDLDPAALHVAVRFGTRAGEIVNLVAEGAGPAQLPADYAVDPAVMRATGAANGIEVLQAFSGDLVDPSKAEPGQRMNI